MNGQPRSKSLAAAWKSCDRADWLFCPRRASSGTPRKAFDAPVATTRTDFSGVSSADEFVATPRAHSALADAGLPLREYPVPIQLLDELATRHGGWPVRASRARGVRRRDGGDASSRIPLLFAKKFLETFGNDVALWDAMRRAAPPEAAWTEALLARLAGEALALPTTRPPGARSPPLSTTAIHSPRSPSGSSGSVGWAHE